MAEARVAEQWEVVASFWVAAPVLPVLVGHLRTAKAVTGSPAARVAHPAPVRPSPQRTSAAPSATHARHPHPQEQSRTHPPQTSSAQLVGCCCPGMGRIPAAAGARSSTCLACAGAAGRSGSNPGPSLVLLEERRVRTTERLPKLRREMEAPTRRRPKTARKWRATRSDASSVRASHPTPVRPHVSRRCHPPPHRTCCLAKPGRVPVL